MSVKVMAAVWDRYPGGGSELLALLALADWADDDGRCWPSIANVATKCRLSRSQAQRVLHGLIEGGHLVLEGNAAGGPPGATRRYRIALESFTGRMDAAPTGRAGATGRAHATGRTDARDGSHGCAETGRMGATQPISEPPVNHQEVHAASRKEKSSKPKFDARQHLAALGVNSQLVDDFVQLRKAKRAPISPTVITGIEREAGKAGMTIADALAECCSRGWAAFRADWVGGRSKQQSPRRAPAPENFAATDYGQSGLI